MKLNKITLAMLAATSTLLTACGSDSKSNDSKPKDKAADNRTPCATVGFLPKNGETIVIGDKTKAICDLEGVISASATLNTDYVYRLNGYVSVGNGNTELKGAAPTSKVTLTVKPGVEFRSTGRGSLVITRGSQLIANGTAEAPIVMSSFDKGFDGQGEWGGLVVQGYAKNNNCPDNSTSAACDVADEAGTGFHGGNKDEDNSGSISYLIVAEGGYEIEPDSEVNGITLHSVGYGTKIENVMVYNNADDGIEFFGGAANVKNLILVDNSDESLDWDDGWRGNVQFSLIRQGLVYKGDHGIEADNKGKSNTAIPVSKPTIANVTFQTSVKGSDDLFRFKLGTQGTLVNIAADNYKECVRVEHKETAVTLTNLLAECQAYKDSTFVTAKEGATAAQITGAPTASSTVELGNAFQVTGSESTLANAATLTSANGSTNFFDAKGASYIGAVAPTVSDKSNAWWAWADKVIPAAFK